MTSHYKRILETLSKRNKHGGRVKGQSPSILQLERFLASESSGLLTRLSRLLRAVKLSMIAVCACCKIIKRGTYHLTSQKLGVLTLTIEDSLMVTGCLDHFQ